MVEKKNNSGGCSCNSGCCETVQNNSVDKRNIVIDFLYLDLSVCTPCQGTEAVLDEAIKDVTNILESTGVKAIINKVNVLNEGLAIKFKFVSSPTIHINGCDIQLEVKESSCQTCSDLSGEETDCRIWVYQGKEYNVPPKAMIIEAILKEAYGSTSTRERDKEYSIPENLKRFYIAMKGKTENKQKKNSCCSPNSKSCCC